MKYTLGIDLHKINSTWVLIDEQYREIWKATVLSHPTHIINTIKKLPKPPENIQVAIEPVAGWRFVTAILEEHGMSIHLANTMKVGLIAKSKQKTDSNDAKTLASVLQSGFFPEAHKVPDHIYELRTILRERNYLVRMRTSAKNRLHGVATTDGLYKLPNLNPLSKKSKEFINKSENIVLQNLHQLIDSLDGQIDSFSVVLKKKSKEFKEVKLLTTIPGVGLVTALTIIAEVSDFSRFKDGHKLASYAGIVPRQRSSGEKIRFGAITYEGSKNLRTALVESAMRITEKNAPELFDFVKKLKERISPKKARVALARKLCVIMWSMVTNNQPYNYCSFSHATKVE